jgi:hypothetical protein
LPTKTLLDPYNFYDSIFSNRLFLIPLPPYPLPFLSLLSCKVSPKHADAVAIPSNFYNFLMVSEWRKFNEQKFEGSLLLNVDDFLSYGFVFPPDIPSIFNSSSVITSANAPSHVTR